MGNAVTWIDLGQDGWRVCIDLPLRKNGMPPIAAREAVSKMLENFNPAAFDPAEPVPELVARAAERDGIVRHAVEHIELSADSPPVPVYDGDDIPGYRCANGACTGD